MNCKNCGEISGNYDLCRDCYYDYEDGLIDKCKCGNYKGAEFEFCYNCYKNLKLDKPQKKTKINDSSIKGRLAEAIIEEMFISMGYRVFRFGMENTIPGFAEMIREKAGTRISQVKEQIRKMPDFIVVKDSNIAYVEVKYRTSGNFDFNKEYNKKGGYPYKNAYFILVTPNHIKIQRASELEKEEDFVYLGDCKDFETDREIILQYIEFCKKFFGNC
ncbi:MAG: hypothetical protein AABW51_03180 [Nanoarchaeota archaeon]